MMTEQNRDATNDAAHAMRHAADTFRTDCCNATAEVTVERGQHGTPDWYVTCDSCGADVTAAWDDTMRDAA